MPVNELTNSPAGTRPVIGMLAGDQAPPDSVWANPSLLLLVSWYTPTATQEPAAGQDTAFRFTMSAVLVPGGGFSPLTGAVASDQVPLARVAMSPSCLVGAGQLKPDGEAR